MKLYVEKLYEDANLPLRATPEDTGLDLYAHSFLKVYQNFGGNGERLVEGDKLKEAAWDGEIRLGYLERALIGTGIKVALKEEGYDIQVRPRSGLALKKGLTVLNTPGTIDKCYRNELGVILVNLSRAEQTIKLGDRIAQLVVAPVVLPIIELTRELPSTEDRGGGFGSTDKGEE